MALEMPKYVTGIRADSMEDVGMERFMFQKDEAYCSKELHGSCHSDLHLECEGHVACGKWNLLDRVALEVTAARF